HFPPSGSSPRPRPGSPTCHQIWRPGERTPSPPPIGRSSPISWRRCVADSRSTRPPSTPRSCGSWRRRTAPPPPDRKSTSTPPVEDRQGDQMSDALQTLIDGLNEDLSAEYQAVIMYRTYASLASGPIRQDLRAFFETEIPDELSHAAFLADKIVALGGTPTTSAAPVPPANDNRQMLEHALAAEVETIERRSEERRVGQEGSCEG